MGKRGLKVLFVLLGSCLWGAQGWAVQPGSSPSIHQIESEKYYGLGGPFPVLDEAIRPRSLRTGGPSHVVYGYYPYWTSTDFSQFRFELLTHVAYFAGPCNADGSQDDVGGWPRIDLVNAAHTVGTKVIYTFPCFGSSKIHGILSNPTYRQRAIDTAITAVIEGGADGLDMDWEGLGSQDTDAFTDFIADVRAALDAVDPGLELTAALPAVNWSEKYDLVALSQYFDLMVIMGYGYHWSGGDPGPVSPVESGDLWSKWNITWSIDYYLDLLGAAQASRIVLAVPYYGRDWPSVDHDIPGDQTADGSALTYSNVLDFVPPGMALWDDASQTPYYLYQDGSTYRQLWFDDAYSLGLKYDRIKEKGIAGVGMWALNYDVGHETLWDLLGEKFLSEEPTDPSPPGGDKEFPLPGLSGTALSGTSVTGGCACQVAPSAGRGVTGSLVFALLAFLISIFIAMRTDHPV